MFELTKIDRIVRYTYVVFQSSLPAILASSDDRTLSAIYLNCPIGIDTDIHDTVTALIGCRDDFYYLPQPLASDRVYLVST